MQFKLYLSVLLLSITISILGQDEMDLLLESEMGNTTEYAMGTFFSTRILNGQSTQMMPKKDSISEFITGLIILTKALTGFGVSMAPIRTLVSNMA